MLTSIETVEDFSLISKDLPCLLRRFLSAVFLAQSKQPFADELRVRDVFPPVDLDAPADAVRGHHVGEAGTQDLEGFVFTVAAQQQHAGEAGLLGQHLAQHLDQRVGVVPLLLIRHHEAAEQVPFNVGLGEGRLGDAVNLGSNGVAAGVGVVGGLEAHGVQRVEAHHG